MLRYVQAAGGATCQQCYNMPAGATSILQATMHITLGKTCSGAPFQRACSTWHSQESHGWLTCDAPAGADRRV
jgi:hypothetical protein